MRVRPPQGKIQAVLRRRTTVDNHDLADHTTAAKYGVHIIVVLLHNKELSII